MHWNVSRIKRLKALSPSKNPPDLKCQYAPDYPLGPSESRKTGKDPAYRS